MSAEVEAFLAYLCAEEWPADHSAIDLVKTFIGLAFPVVKGQPYVIVLRDAIRAKPEYVAKLFRRLGDNRQLPGLLLAIADFMGGDVHPEDHEHMTGCIRRLGRNPRLGEVVLALADYVEAVYRFGLVEAVYRFGLVLPVPDLSSTS